MARLRGIRAGQRARSAGPYFSYSVTRYGRTECDRRPADSERVDAGGGIASMATAAFLIRDAGVPGENIHILETLDVPGGSLDGAASPVQPGYVTLGRRMLEEEAYRCLWNLLESVPRPRRPRQVRAARHRRLQLLGHDARSRAAHQFRPRDPRRGGVRVQHQRPDGADRAARAVRARARRPPDR